MEYVDKLPPDNRDLSMFPGQYGWPFLGKTVELVKDTLAMCNKHYDRYGPVSRLDMVRNQRVLMCLGPEFNEAALFDPKGNFSVAGGYASSLGTLYPEGMLLRDDKKHKKTRRASQPAFKTDALKSYVDMLIPTQIDPTMAPPGKHMMSVFVQYAPPKINGGDWTAEDKAGFEKTVIDQISNYSPDFKDLILHCETRTPQDIENEVGLTEGNIFMGELTFDQLLFNRPFPGYAQYRGPVKGMYMCSSGTHPGGGVMAAPGANAAREILMDKKLANTVPGGYDDD